MSGDTSTSIHHCTNSQADFNVQTSHSPIIVGDQYDLAETLALKQGSDHNGGLLAKSDYQSALLSMSGVDGKGGIDGELCPV